MHGNCSHTDDMIIKYLLSSAVLLSHFHMITISTFFFVVYSFGVKLVILFFSPQNEFALCSLASPNLSFFFLNENLLIFISHFYFLGK